MIKLKVRSGIPRLKADGTATIPLNTLIEMDKSIFDFLATSNFDKQSLVVTISKEEDYPQLITTEALYLTSLISDDTE